jgi:hypothetical protein
MRPAHFPSRRRGDEGAAIVLSARVVREWLLAVRSNHGKM